MDTASALQELCDELSIPLLFKSSYRKANRSRLDSFSGIGDDKALAILRQVKSELGLPITTDIHESTELDVVSEIIDVLQIPAFLCRQTALLVAAAETGKIVNVKKGQFMAPSAMEFVAEKLRATSPDQEVWLTERGTTFGYGDLVVDFRGIVEMKDHCDRVVMDCTHSLQRPNSASGVTGGQPEYISLMARTAIAAGADALFIETHPDPSAALSDGANMLPLSEMRTVLESALKVKSAVS